jgi:creatinine amidohydrolase/Fe(II)-dependent formamide hydrolase-like protein
MSCKPCLPAWLPQQVNTGPWLTHYTVDELEQQFGSQRTVLPICSWDTPVEELEGLGGRVLSPLYVEALDGPLKSALLARIPECFPYYQGSRRAAETRAKLEIVEVPGRSPKKSTSRPKVLTFSVDTAVEQHGPHLPLATDRIQSYGVLTKLAEETPGLELGPPADYGHLTWGLPRGLSIDITPALLTHYVANYARAIADRYRAESLYVVDVHGSPVHRQAIQEGLAVSGVKRWKFRWLYEPLVEFTFERGDQHAGGVETAVVEAIKPELLDARWWPGRIEDLAAGQMTVELALQLHGNLADFVNYAESNPWNGIVGRIHNYNDVNGHVMLDRMLNLARRDVHDLLGPA